MRHDADFQIGDWILRRATSRLERDGQEHVLDPKELGVLLHLAERAPDVVSTDELFDCAWRGVVVGDNAVRQVITRLRRLFEDDARQPRYIETLSKRGYRLIAAVEAVGTRVHRPPRSSTREDSPALERYESRAARRWILIGTPAAILLILSMVYLKGGETIGWGSQVVMRLMSNPVEQNIAFARTADGVRIAYATSGSGPPLILVNGFATHLTAGLGSPVYDLAGYLRWYARDHLTVHYDGRGFGLSDRNVEDFSLDARIADLEAVVGALGVERFALYGYSAGSRTAIVYAAIHPERVSHLVLAAASARTPTTSERRESLQGLFDFIESSWDDRLSRRMVADYLMGDASIIERNVAQAFLDRAADGPAIAGFFRAHLGIDVSEQAQKIRVPTLIVAGDGDPGVPMAVAAHLASLIPHARFEVLEDVRSHVQVATNDPRLMRMVSNFLELR